MSADTPSSTFPLGRYQISVRWGDMDAFNHVNNTVYLRYLEEARLQWMLATPGASSTEHSRPVLASCEIQFRRPIEWPATVIVEMFCERVGTSSVTLGYQLVTVPDAASTEEWVHAQCRTVMVWTDTHTGRPVPISSELRTALGLN